MSTAPLSRRRTTELQPVTPVLLRGYTIVHKTLGKFAGVIINIKGTDAMVKVTSTNDYLRGRNVAVGESIMLTIAWCEFTEARG
jgi:hypothetical protein